ncbi:tRNA pseudouridine synthase A [Methylacidimicrobium sp. AP8]|uniref:tRNA pseudouridine(38-40) synthase TruA n=1 Tax=Methylacidimicrobium sp. AP8 TaxID=2730359 RepID=UPI0018BF8EB6|nr:tRNA pseudouridine(38-40) synthase TruA [Methylacidimicrobium sp. AP8]CAB4244321.1 tRNA pseudouridine synthase A [Methylacidimicrobium sp. AP8]
MPARKEAGKSGTRSAVEPAGPALVGYRLELSYVGTGFSGWQRQKGRPSIQEALESAVARIWGRSIPVAGASRTDAGVHALRQAASFVAPPKLAPAELRRALNYYLPEAIRVCDVHPVAPSFHARFAARAKTYEYRLWNHEVLDPFLVDRVWHVPMPLAIAAMQEAGNLFVGTMDFSAFGTNSGKPSSSTVRTISDLRLLHRGPSVRIRITGDGFLYHMVRNIVGALVRVGKGRLSLAGLRDILESRDRKRAPASAPPWGLYLVRVYYGPIRRKPVAGGPLHWSNSGVRSRRE